MITLSCPHCGQGVDVVIKGASEIVDVKRRILEKIAKKHRISVDRLKYGQCGLAVRAEAVSALAAASFTTEEIADVFNITHRHVEKLLNLHKKKR